MYGSNLKFLAIIISILFAFQLRSQIPDNFEFLDHRDRNVDLGAVSIVGDKIYYVSHYYNGDSKTELNVIDSSGNLETLFSVPVVSHGSDSFTIDDTSAIIVIRSLRDFDLDLPGYYYIKISPNEIGIDSMFREANPGSLGVSSVAIDSKGQHVIYTRQGIMSIMDKTIVENIADDSACGSYLFYNKEDQLFAIGNRSICRFDGEKFVDLAKYDNFVYDVIPSDTLNYVLNGDLRSGIFIIDYYNLDFSEKINSINLPARAFSLDHFEFKDDEVRTMISHNNSLELVSIDTSGILTSIYSLAAKDEEILKLLPITEEGRYLIGGYYGEAKFSTHIFFRNLSLIEQNNYGRVNIQVEELKVEKFLKDSSIVDTTLRESDFLYNVFLGVRNHGEKSVTHFNVFPIDRMRLDPTRFDFEILESLEPGEFSYSFADVATWGESRNLINGGFFPFFVPGANFKFNTSPFFDLEVTVDVEELVEDPSFTLYPNPVEEILRIQIGQAMSLVSMYDMQGRLIKSESISGNDIEINVKDLLRGTYFLKVILEDRKSYLTSKFVKL